MSRSLQKSHYKNATVHNLPKKGIQSAQSKACASKWLLRMVTLTMFVFMLFDIGGHGIGLGRPRLRVFATPEKALLGYRGICG
jgi:hypothetical protein